MQVSSCPAPTVVSATALSATSVQIEFSRRINPASVNANGSQFAGDNGLAISAAVVDDRTVTLTTSSQGNSSYAVSVANTVTDTLGTGVGTPNTAMFAGFVTRAVLRLTEIAPSIASATINRDLIELKAITGGTLQGITVTQALSIVDTFVTLPAVTVATGDVIVVHLNPDSNAAAESASKMQSPSAMFPANYDTAWDILGTTQNVTHTARVIEVRDSFGTLQDAAAFLHSSTVPTSGFVSRVEAIQTLGHWLPADCGGSACDATNIAGIVVDWAGTGTTAAGNTVRRAVGAADTHTKNDWSVGPHTLGAG